MGIDIKKNQEGIGQYINCRWATILFMFAYMMSFVDRQILSIFITPLKKDLHIDNVHFGILNGFSFACLFGLISIPIARQTDRRNRLPIMILSIVVWSSATCACAFANSFGALFAGRAFVGAGEAALAPAMLSYLADYVDEGRMAGVVGIFSLGSFLGAGLSYILGGALLSFSSGTTLGGYEVWRVAFVVAGIPGYIIAAAIAVLLSDFKRVVRKDSGKLKKVSSVVAEFRDRWVFFCLHMTGYTFLACVLYTLLGWSAALYFAKFAVSPLSIGWLVGACFAVGGGCGSLVSGYVANRLYGRFSTAAPYIVGSGSGFLATVFVVASILSPEFRMSVGLLFVGAFFASMSMPSENSSLQMAVAPEMRGRFSAILLFVNNVLGLSLSSFVVGFLAQHVFRGNDGIELSEAIVVGVCGICGSALVWAACRIRNKSRLVESGPKQGRLVVE